MRAFLILIRKYPKQSILVVTALLFAGILEGFGLSAMLPLLSTVISDHVGGEQVAASGFSAKSSPAERMVRETFEAIGLPATIEVFIAVILGAIVLKSVVMLIAKIGVGYTVANIATDLRLEFLRNLLVSRWEFHLQHPIGILGASMGESGRASKSYQSGALMTVSVAQVMVYVVVAFLVSWQATLATLVAGALIFFLLKPFLKKSRNAGDRRTKVNRLLGKYFYDSLLSLKPIKAMAQESLAESVLFKQVNKLNSVLQKQVRSKQYLSAFQEPLRIVFLLVGFYVVLIILRFPVASVMVLFVMAGRVLSQLSRVMELYQKMLFFESGFWAVHEKIKETKKMREPEFGNIPPAFEKEIRLDRVSFAYAKNEVLRDVSLIFPAGLISAIIGPSGSGKTTVVDLIIGLLKPKQGTIWLDNVPLGKIDLHRWRQLIGYVPQETWLLHDSVFNNVTFGDPKLNKDDAIQALRAAGVWDFVQSLPKGINGTVGERGGKLSGGQRQRIAIARALVRKPKLLILDEATTALDPENEKAICRTMSQLRGKLTIMAISHQPAVLEVADQAFRIQDGTVVPVTDIQASAGLKPDAIHSGFNRAPALAANPVKLK